MQIREVFDRKRFVFLDGGMGTQLQARGLQPGQKPELAALEMPEVLTAIHTDYANAGADILLANTFGANAKKLAGCPCTVEQVVSASIACARSAAAETGALVALDIGPLGELLVPAGTLAFEDAYNEFAQVIRAGAAAGADLVFLETMTDLYELTMMNGYLRFGMENNRACFDIFYRKQGDMTAYAVAAGLEQAVEYVKNLHFSKDDIAYLRSLNIFDEAFLTRLSTLRFTGEILAVPEGTVIFPGEPIVRVIAPIMEAQLLKTALLNIINHQTLIATKASRVVQAARGDGVLEFGLRRAQGPDAGIYGARAAMIGGCQATSNVLTGQLFDVPVGGTHAHS